MTREQRQAIENLRARALEEGKVHTHERRFGENSLRGRVPIPVEHKAGRIVEIRGKAYRSISAASRALRVRPGRIYEWIRDGTAIVKSPIHPRKRRA